MRTALLILGVVAVAAARSLEKRDDEEVDHWVAATLANSEFLLRDEKSIIDGIVGDLNKFLELVGEVERGEKDKPAILAKMSEVIGLVELHEMAAEELKKHGIKLFETISWTIPEVCTKTAVLALKECRPMVDQEFNCLRTVTKGIVEKLKSDEAFEKKIGQLKFFIMKVAAEIQDAKEIVECEIKHWAEAWKFEETDLQDAEKMKKLKELGGRIYQDLTAMRDNLKALLTGTGGDQDVALQHVLHAVRLAEFHEKQGGDSITPETVESECSRDAIDTCPLPFVKIGTCIHKLVDDALKKFVETDDKDVIIDIAKFTKGSVLTTAKIAKTAYEIEEKCKKAKEDEAKNDKKRELLNLLRRMLDQKK